MGVVSWVSFHLYFSRTPSKAVTVVRPELSHITMIADDDRHAFYDISERTWFQLVKYRDAPLQGMFVFARWHSLSFGDGVVSWVTFQEETHS